MSNRKKDDYKKGETKELQEQERDWENKESGNQRKDKTTTTEREPWATIPGQSKEDTP